MRLCRGDIIDMLVRDGESLVLTAGRCLRISAEGTETVLYLDRPRSMADLEAHLGKVFGSPPEGAVDRLVEDLVGADVLQILAD